MISKKELKFSSDWRKIDISILYTRIICEESNTTQYGKTVSNYPATHYYKGILYDVYSTDFSCISTSIIDMITHQFNGAEVNLRLEAYNDAVKIMYTTMYYQEEVYESKLYMYKTSLTGERINPIDMPDKYMYKFSNTLNPEFDNTNRMLIVRGEKTPVHVPKYPVLDLPLDPLPAESIEDIINFY